MLSHAKSSLSDSVSVVGFLTSDEKPPFLGM